mmetsp:Transcript_27365/g.58975  ORF Transcript_27365/g.58975 Transcript_27365/m.58975 type:complete len:616 (+) Transcript_27365:214-2061(+)
MPLMLHHDEKDGATRYNVADILSYLAPVASPRMTALKTKTTHHTLHSAEVAMRLLRDVAVRRRHHGNNDDNVNSNDNGVDYNDHDDDNDNDGKDDDGCSKDKEDETESADVLVRRIRTNDPKLTTLALRHTRTGIIDWNKTSDRDLPLSSFRVFTQNTIQQLTDALRTNHTIRSISCRYDLKYPIISHRLCSYEIDCNVDGDNVDVNGYDYDYDYNSNSNDDTLRATSNNIVTIMQERRFFEACVCLPRLESISLTGGNRWRISHLVTILEAAKGLKRLTVRDVLIKSASELYALKRVLLMGGNTRRVASGHAYDVPIPLEAMELTIEDQTDRNETYWSTDATTVVDDDGNESPFDELLQALAASKNIKTIQISKSILSRFRWRPIHDLSTKTLLKLASCQSLSKLVLAGLSVERGGIEAMCEALIERNGHLKHLEFSGCAFNHTVGQSGWNALFRLINHDPDIHIRASSLIYLQRRHRSGSRSNVPDENNVNNINSSSSTNNSTDNNNSNNNYYSGEELGARSGFIQRPREDISFSLRDREAADRHFRNRGLDIEYMLQEAGLFQLLQAGEQAGFSDWIDVMAKVKEDSIALFYILRENPTLCDQSRPRANRVI